MSADSRVASELGDDVAITVGVTRTKDDDQNRYTHLALELVVDASGLAPERRERLEKAVAQAVEKLCTVGRTVEAGAETDLSVTSQG
ncbi:OsmC family protein [Litorihabitans aurantiacus]|uniref:Uncharacterized protein n=1 Tax=Litorihabitans aurantiacus TaxID=1930061 RepID=A0AA37XF14_9MICO|nr:OsmC family protein [Litorihabitans aurantiacus]GMA32087.1 hypothetical protein GCM10025875_20790 [Litorihabitans aurantiacus]